MILSAPLEQTEQLTVSVVSLRTGQPGSTYEIEGFFCLQEGTELDQTFGHQSGQVWEHLWNLWGHQEGIARYGTLFGSTHVTNEASM